MINPIKQELLDIDALLSCAEAELSDKNIKAAEHYINQARDIALNLAESLDRSEKN